MYELLERVETRYTDGRVRCEWFDGASGERILDTWCDCADLDAVVAILHPLAERRYELLIASPTFVDG